MRSTPFIITSPIRNSNITTYFTSYTLIKFSNLSSTRTITTRTRTILTLRRLRRKRHHIIITISSSRTINIKNLTNNRLTSSIIRFNRHSLRNTTLKSSRFMTFLRRFRIIFLITTILQTTILLRRTSLSMTFKRRRQYNKTFHKIRPYKFTNRLSHRRTNCQSGSLFRIITFNVYYRSIFLSRLRN